jgi:hypothetical protein
MNVILAGTIFAIVLSARNIGLRQLAEEGESASKGLGAIEGAIFGLLGLILAFSFSGALTRFDARRHLVVEETNDIGTAWLRIALLPADAQSHMRTISREAHRVIPHPLVAPAACRPSGLTGARRSGRTFDANGVNFRVPLRARAGGDNKPISRFRIAALVAAKKPANGLRFN